MSGPARMQGPPAERHSCAVKDADPRHARISERVRGLVFFLLTLTYMEVGHPSLIGSWKSSPSSRHDANHETIEHNFRKFGAALFRSCFDREALVDWNDHYRKRGSSVVAHLRKWAPELVAADHRVLVIGAEDHHVRVPMTNSRSETLIRRPHVSKTDIVPSREFFLDVCRLKTLGDLVWSFPL